MALTKADFLTLANDLSGGRVRGVRTLKLSPMPIVDGELVPQSLINYGENQLSLLKPNVPYLMTLKEFGTRWSDSFLVMINDDGEVEDASHLEDDE